MEKINVETSIGTIYVDDANTLKELFGAFMDAMELNERKYRAFEYGFSEEKYRHEKDDYKTTGELYKRVAVQIANRL